MTTTRRPSDVLQASRLTLVVITLFTQITLSICEDDQSDKNGALSAPLNATDGLRNDTEPDTQVDTGADTNLDRPRYGPGTLLLPVEDSQLLTILDIGFCRVACGKSCWQGCLLVRNNLSLCDVTTNSTESNRVPVESTLSVPCTVYSRRGPTTLTDADCDSPMSRSVLAKSVMYDPRSLTLTITWALSDHKPTPSNDVYDKNDDVILVMYWRDASQKNWTYLNMFTDGLVRIPVEDVLDFTSLDLLLVVLDPVCVRGSVIIDIPNSVLHGPYSSSPHIFPPPVHLPRATPSPAKYKPLVGDLMADEGDTSIVLTTEQTPKLKHFNITVSVDDVIISVNNTRALQVNVTWSLPKWLIQTLSRRVEQRITWARDTCVSNKSLPGCDVAPKLHTAIRVGSSSNKVKTYSLSSVHPLTYNSDYWVTVTVGDTMSDRYNFATPGCLYPTSAFTRCLHKPLCSYNNSCQRNADFLSWEINLTCWQPAVDRPGEGVRALLAWSRPTQSPRGRLKEYRILQTWSTGREVIHADTSEVELVLKRDTDYDIQLLAVMSIKGEKTLLHSQHFVFNTNASNLHEQWPQCQTFPSDKRRPGVISAAVLGGCLTAVLTIFVLYKKRHSFRDIIITKATVAKSNSYKSTLGGYTDIKDTKQLLGRSEDWEVDPLQVALGSELGQGAFGRVLTGTYEDRKVAIKILKEGAPFFQRDDLLREILMMKNLGSHPHIVGFVGACTVREPIALIMEYMPYGNLQHFLKRCRHDASVSLASDGYHMHYEALDEVGGTEAMNLSPRDFLSYSRQIAMAMEYLSEHQYVHRDLAARNVLVGANKTVKLCDFGLARLVYSEDQYYRLTGGRLPVRWMAPESLRERMYTSQSDVWAFGILLWEIVTLGCCPYPNVTLGELFTKICEGYRMDQPKNCADELYDIMCQCWCENPHDRPNFTTLRVHLETLLTRDMNYLVLDNIDFSCETSDASSEVFDISMESLVTEQDTVSDCACVYTSIDQAGTSELHQCLLHQPPEGAMDKPNCKKHSGQTFSTWTLQGGDLKVWLRMHTLTKSTLSLADLQDSFQQFSKRRKSRHELGSTSSEIHTVSTIV